MRIGILGTGAVGRTLATAFIAEGHTVMLGTRQADKEEVKNWAQQNLEGRVGSPDATAAFGEVIVLATPGLATEEAMQQAGLSHFTGKIIIDATNPIAAAPPQDGVLSYFTQGGPSLMERLQALAPEAYFVKAFNSVGSAFMYKPQFGGIMPTMFICGNQEAAKQTVTTLLHSFGWEAEDMGSAASAGAIESLCILWCLPGFLRNDWAHAFKMLKAPL